MTGQQAPGGALVVRLGRDVALERRAVEDALRVAQLPAAAAALLRLRA